MPDVRSQLIDWMFALPLADDRSREQRKNEVNQRKTFAIYTIWGRSEPVGILGNRRLVGRRQLDRYLDDSSGLSSVCKPPPGVHDPVEVILLGHLANGWTKRSFGLGSGDAIRLYVPSGLTHHWRMHTGVVERCDSPQFLFNRLAYFERINELGERFLVHVGRTPRQGLEGLVGVSDLFSS